jgi:hypothetical protein
MQYLHYTVSGGKIVVPTKKVDDDKDWPVHTAQKEVCNFLQFCNFNTKFIPHFSDLTAPLTDLPWKSKPQMVALTPTCQEVFEIVI